jgi:hypothetical protein
MNHSPFYGSSETTRKAPDFFFGDFYQYGHSEHVPRMSESFLEWFIGFFEGDGCFVVGSSGRLSAKIGQKEKKILEWIQFQFGFGNLSSWQQNGEVFWHWKVDSLRSLDQLAILFAGNLILPKRQKQFVCWVETGKRKKMFQNLCQKPWLGKVSLTNAWLSGFIDAEGCFYAHFGPPSKSSKVPYSLKQKMTLTQKDFWGGEVSVFKQILNLVDSQTKISFFRNNKISEHNFIHIDICSLHSQKHLIDYLFIYRLRTSKYIAFRRWWRIYLRRKDGVHLSEKGLARIWRLVQSVNNQTNHSLLQKDLLIDSH